MGVRSVKIDYDHSATEHSITGPEAALPLLLGQERPSSVLDVGCGIGTWLLAAQRLGITDVFGVDGIDISPNTLLVPKHLFAHHDLSKPLNLGRRFDLLLCLEVAEHLDPEVGEALVTSLTQHADKIFFSAAAPGQPGQHHVNCRWPSYWQGVFNDRGFVCVDDVRWRMWSDERIEHWYRQNMFCATKNASLAGHEPRIKPVIHPDFLPGYPGTEAFANALRLIADGYMSTGWYLRTTYSIVYSRFRRKLISS